MNGRRWDDPHTETLAKDLTVLLLCMFALYVAMVALIVTGGH